MAHARQQIREQIATLLKVSPVSYKAVFETRIPPSRAVMPFLLVFASDESSTQMLIHPTGMYDRSVNINVVGALKMPGTGNGTSNTQTVEDLMDAMSVEIETKLKASVVTKAKTIALQSTSMEVIISEADGTVSHAELTQTWVCTYDTVEGLPEVLA